MNRVENYQFSELSINEIEAVAGGYYSGNACYSDRQLLINAGYILVSQPYYGDGWTTYDGGGGNWWFDVNESAGLVGEMHGAPC